MGSDALACEGKRRTATAESSLVSHTRHTRGCVCDADCAGSRRGAILSPHRGCRKRGGRGRARALTLGEFQRCLGAGNIVNKRALPQWSVSRHGGSRSRGTRLSAAKATRENSVRRRINTNRPGSQHAVGCRRATGGISPRKLRHAEDTSGGGLLRSRPPRRQAGCAERAST